MKFRRKNELSEWGAIVVAAIITTFINMNMMIGIVTLILKEWQGVKESGIGQSALYPSLCALNDHQATISPVCGTNFADTFFFCQQKRGQKSHSLNS